MDAATGHPLALAPRWRRHDGRRRRTRLGGAGMTEGMMVIQPQSSMPATLAVIPAPSPAVHARILPSRHWYVRFSLPLSSFPTFLIGNPSSSWQRPDGFRINDVRNDRRFRLAGGGWPEAPPCHWYVRFSLPLSSFPTFLIGNPSSSWKRPDGFRIKDVRNDSRGRFGNARMDSA